MTSAYEWVMAGELSGRIVQNEVVITTATITLIVPNIRSGFDVMQVERTLGH